MIVPETWSFYAHGTSRYKPSSGDRGHCAPAVGARDAPSGLVKLAPFGRLGAADAAALDTDDAAALDTNAADVERFLA